uniref:Anti-proliferative protein domain-containing protein n=1 Tax=Leptobrachium leishanense TaxID=445787 RepID=A0A8C5Q8P6_9ANUR
METLCAGDHPFPGDPTKKMRQEVSAAIDFMLKILRLNRCWAPDQLEALKLDLLCCLSNRFRGHWYPDEPHRGQGYRCIRINASQPVDKSLLTACNQCGIDYMKLGLPEELSIWIDPYEVCGRFGENTKCFTIARFPKEVRRALVPAPEPETSDYFSGSASSESVSENSSDDELIDKDVNMKDLESTESDCFDQDPPQIALLEGFVDQEVSLEGSKLLSVWKGAKAPTEMVEVPTLSPLE